LPGFHAILVVRDEGDLIAQTLEHLLSWCDSLAVYDTGSGDGTWETVRGFAARDRRITLIGSEPVLFTNGLRAWVFERVRAGFRAGDWVVRADADEFYHVRPPDFVRGRLAPAEGRVCARLYDFVLTRGELRAWQEGRETVADRARSIAERRRCFRYDDYPELRLFRYRPRMRWPPTQHNPVNAGLLARARIPVRHYRARDPLQVQRRCALREPEAAAVPWSGIHWRIPDWRCFVLPDDDAALVRWEPGHPLPEREPPPISATAPSRLAAQVLYRCGLVGLLDRTRRPFPLGFAPSPRPPAVSEVEASNIGSVRERPYLREEPGQLRSWRRRAGFVDPAPGAT
jgi:glycosyl transferase family 2